MDITKFVLQGQRSVTLSDDVAGNLQNEIEELQSKTSEIDTIKGGILGNASGVGAMFPVAKEYKKEIKNALPCLGGSYSSATYPELFDVIGVAYGGTIDYTYKSKTSSPDSSDFNTSSTTATSTYRNSSKYALEFRCKPNRTSRTGYECRVISWNLDGSLNVSYTVSSNTAESAYSMYGHCMVMGDEVIATASKHSERPYYTMRYSKDGGNSFSSIIGEYTANNNNSDLMLVGATKDYIFSASTGQIGVTGNGWLTIKTTKTGATSIVSESTKSQSTSWTSIKYCFYTGKEYSYVQKGSSLYYIDADTTDPISVTGSPGLYSFDGQKFNDGGYVWSNDKLYVLNTNRCIMEITFKSKSEVNSYRVFSNLTLSANCQILGGFELSGYLYVGTTTDGLILVDLSNKIASKFSFSGASITNPVLINDRIVTSNSSSIYSGTTAMKFKTPNINNLPGTTMYITTKASE